MLKEALAPDPVFEKIQEEPVQIEYGSKQRTFSTEKAESQKYPHLETSTMHKLNYFLSK